MKRFVSHDFLIPGGAGAVVAVIVAVTGAGVGATYGIALGLLTILLAIRLGPDRLELWRQQRASAAPRRSPR
jgi:hypothetical protein